MFLCSKKINDKNHIHPPGLVLFSSRSLSIFCRHREVSANGVVTGKLESHQCKTRKVSK